MEIALGLVAVIVMVVVILLALLRAEIRREDRAASLDRLPDSLSAALTRRLLGLHVRRPAPRSDGMDNNPFLTEDRKEGCPS